MKYEVGQYYMVTLGDDTGPMRLDKIAAQTVEDQDERYIVLGQPILVFSGYRFDMYGDSVDGMPYTVDLDTPVKKR